MTEFSNLVDLLREAVAQPAKLATLAPKIQELVWNSEVLFPSRTTEDAARDLAYDLEYYVSDPKDRAADSAYFGEERAIAEIRSALKLMHGR